MVVSGPPLYMMFDVAERNEMAKRSKTDTLRVKYLSTSSLSREKHLV